MVDFTGLRALIVEDEGAIALLIEDMLLDLGCEIAAAAAELGKACELARTARIDFAILDLNLAGVSALPVAEILRERGIPFMFSTGYGTSAVSGVFERYPVVAKPFVMNELRDKIAAALDLAKGRAG
ncbi:response regulator [Steroidobacter sp. S1-65]|uniref:Response regulator n=1 Tax=Steroidobacter gossypii TaxID=2805490 RepID=A0ABS1WVC6_9GAMM|nr:response regulator [Steroidobacter gossypii]MBM0104929.1 response regulator [Steroidobacter gossypii]